MSRTLVLTALGVLAQGRLGEAQVLPVAKISKWEVAANGTSVEFKSLNAVLGAPEDGVEFQNQTANNLFEFNVKTDQLTFSNDCRCYRYYTLTVRSRDGQISRHKFRAFPSGSFEDQQVLLHMTITRGEESDGDTISLPIASAPGLEPRSLIVATTPEPMTEVSLGGPADVQVILRNPSAQMPVVVSGDIEVAADAPALWQGTPVIAAPSPIRLNPGASTTVRVRLEPHSRNAIAASFRPSAKEKAHTALKVKVGYANPLFQAREGVTELTVPIRFTPNLWTLAGFLSLGVVLGSAVLVLSRKAASFRRMPRSVMTALGVAIILELVGMFMAENDSKFVVFGFDLDPWQSLPVMLLGIGNGLLGLKAAQQLKFIKDEQP